MIALVLNSAMWASLMIRRLFRTGRDYAGLRIV